MKKKICLITGANSGIGKAAAIQIAENGYCVILACRNQERGEKARSEVRRRSGNKEVELILVDMSLQKSIREMATEYLNRYDSLDVLIHNAAFFDVSTRIPIITEEGFEITWATNHLGPVLLTQLLLPALKKSIQGRIITISSKGLILFPWLKVDTDDPEFKKRSFSVSRAYYQSKLAQEIFTIYLSEQLVNTAVTANCIRVTNVKIDLMRYPQLKKRMRFLYSIKSFLAISPEEMAHVYTWLAVSSEVIEITGWFFDGINHQQKPHKSALDPAHRSRVMALTFRYLEKGIEKTSP